MTIWHNLPSCRFYLHPTANTVANSIAINYVKLLVLAQVLSILPFKKVGRKSCDTVLLSRPSICFMLFVWFHFYCAP